MRTGPAIVRLYLAEHGVADILKGDVAMVRMVGSNARSLIIL